MRRREDRERSTNCGVHRIVGILSILLERVFVVLETGYVWRCRENALGS
jgi:hypothetical protein